MAPKDYGNVYGLCGFFDGDMKNDFSTVNLGPSLHSRNTTESGITAQSWRYR